MSELTNRGLIPQRSSVGAAAIAFWALLVRDLTVTRKNLREVVPRTLLQPLLLMFVFTYVFPKIGQGVGGTSADASRNILHLASCWGSCSQHFLPRHPVGSSTNGQRVRLYS